MFGSAIGITVFLGALTVWYHVAPPPAALFRGQSISGIVQSINRQLDKTVVIVKDNHFHQLVQVTIHSQTAALPGDTVKVQGIVQRPADFMTDTGRLFPYRDYLASKGIVGLVNNGSVSLAAQGSFSLVRFATVARFHIADIFTKYIAFPIDGIVAGMLVGYQGGVPKTVSDLFRTTGVLHVLVLSGENITLLSIFLSMILRAVPFKVRSFLISFSIILIVLISGTGVAAVRAGIMGGIALTAGLVRRSYIPLRALTLSVLFFFFISPETIFTDPGFHLSVLATIFMVIVLPKIETLFHFLPERFNVRELGMLAVCVPIFMLPYTMYFSGLFPTAAACANILLAIATPFFMLAGASVLAVSWLVPVAQLFGMLTSFVGRPVLRILEALNTLPQLNTPPLAWWGVLGIYAMFFGIVFQFELKQFWFDLRNSFLPLTNSSGKGNR